MSKPENTSTRDPLLHLAGAMSEGVDGYVTGMEAEGQRQLVGSDVLPADAPWADARRPRRTWKEQDAVTLESLGFVKGDPVPGDDLFVRCALPEGWRREGSDHTIWSYVVDERGVRRISVFYKAAFYDRSAHAHVVGVGHLLASEAVYGDDDAALPSSWAVLTEGERADFREHLDDYAAQAAEHPDIYGERLPRVRDLERLARQA